MKLLVRMSGSICLLRPGSSFRNVFVKIANRGAILLESKSLQYSNDPSAVIF